MNNYTWQYLCGHRKETKRLLGISFEQLEQLIELGKVLEEKQKEENERKSPRLISPSSSIGTETYAKAVFLVQYIF